MNNVIACVSTYLSRKPHDNRPDAYRPLRVRVSSIKLPQILIDMFLHICSEDDLIGSLTVEQPTGYWKI